MGTSHAGREPEREPASKAGVRPSAKRQLFPAHGVPVPAHGVPVSATPVLIVRTGTTIFFYANADADRWFEKKIPWVAFAGSSTHCVPPFWVFFRPNAKHAKPATKSSKPIQTVAVLLAHAVSLAGDQPTPRQRVYLAQD